MDIIWFSIITALVGLVIVLVWIYASIFQAQKSILDTQRKLIESAKKKSNRILDFIELLKKQEDINPELCDKILMIGQKINDNSQDEASILVLENKLSKSFQDVVHVLKSNPKWKASEIIQNTEKDLKPIQKENDDIQQEYKEVISSYNQILQKSPTKYVTFLFGYKPI